METAAPPHPEVVVLPAGQDGDSYQQQRDATAELSVVATTWPEGNSTTQADSTHPHMLQLLPGLASASMAGVAERTLDASKVQLGKRLGAGTFATVYQAQLEGSKAKWVVKRLDRVGSDHAQQLSNEVEMLVLAGNHPNLVPFKGWYVDSSNVLCLLLGHCEGGTLSALLKSRYGGADEGYFEEDMVMCWFVQLLLALHHLHGRRILHRDLKPDNVLLSKNYRVLKLADFGVSKQLEAGVGLAVTCLGTPHYMSPEVITHRPYTFASDMWALGAVLYEMAARRPAFDARGLPQLVMKILRNAYTPLPLACSRPVQQLVGMLLRADPQDRPTTADLLGTTLVRKHLQLLLRLAQRVHRAPTPAAATAAGSADIGTTSSEQAGTTSAADRCSSPVVAQQPTDLQQQQQQHGAYTEEVDLGNGLSLALHDMMLAFKRMARAPLHTGAGGNSSPIKRSRISVAAAAGVGDTNASTAVAKAPGTSESNSSSRRPASFDSSNPAALGRSASSSRSSTKAGRTSQTAAGAGCSAEMLDELPGSSTDATASPTPSGGSTTAVHTALPTPAAVPGTKRPLVHAWAASVHWEAQQKKQAEARYQARILEQRMAREQARQRRKELDPAAAAKAAQQQQELQLLEEAYRRRQQQQQQELDSSGNTALKQLSMSAEAAAAAAAAVQDEQLQLLLEQLRGAAGSTSSSPAPAAAVADNERLACDHVNEGEVEEEEGLQGFDTQAFGTELDCENEDYSEALALAAAGAEECKVPDLSSNNSTGGITASPVAAAAAAAGRTWQLVMASLEDDSFAALLPCKASAAPAAALAAAAAPALPVVLGGGPGAGSDEQSAGTPTNEDSGNTIATAAAAAAVSTDSSGLPVLIQSPDSPESSPRSKSRLDSSQQQQQNVLFSQLEQQLDSALSRSDSAAAQELMSSIYRMSLCVRRSSIQQAQIQDQRPLGESAVQQQALGQELGLQSDTHVRKWPQGSVQESFKRPGKVRPKSAAEAVQEQKANTAFAYVVNTMLEKVLLGGAGGAAGLQRSSSSHSMATARRLALQQLQEQQQQVAAVVTAAGSSSRALIQSVTSSASPRLCETSLPGIQPGGQLLPCIHTRRTPCSGMINNSSGTLVAAPGSPFMIDISAVRSGSKNSSKPANRSFSEVLPDKQRPKLAVIGGLAAARSAAAVVPSAELTSLAAGGSSVGSVVAPTDSPSSQNSTPRVNDALQLLRGHRLSGSANLQAPTAAATAVPARGALVHSGANSLAMTGRKSAAAAAEARLVPTRSSKRLSTSTKQLYTESHHSSMSRVPSSAASRWWSSNAVGSRSSSSSGSRPGSSSSGTNSRPSTAGSLQCSSMAATVSSRRPNAVTAAAAAAAAGSGARTSVAPHAVAPDRTLKQAGSTAAVQIADRRHAGHVSDAVASKGSRAGGDKGMVSAVKAYGVKLNRRAST